MNLRVKNPEKIRNLEDLEDILHRLNSYKSSFSGRVVVAELVNPSLGGSYQIMSEQEVSRLVKRRGQLEKSGKKGEYVKRVYSQHYFENLREELMSHSC